MRARLAPQTSLLMSRNFTLRLSTVLAYAAPAIPMSGLGLPLALVVAPLYAKDFDINQSVVGLVFTLVRLFDLIIDPILGYLMDDTRTQWGRRRPWIAGAIVPLMIGVYMLFNPPSDATWVYLTVWVVVCYISYSAITISHMSWGAELSSVYHERSRIQGLREFALVGGMLLVLALPTILAAVGGRKLEDAEIMSAMGWFIVVLMPLLSAVALYFVPEKPPEPMKHADWKAAWRVIANNKNMRRLLLADFFQGLAPGITATLFIYLIAQAFKLPNDWGWLLLLYFLSGLIAVPMWIRLSYSYSKHRTLAAALLYAAVTLPIMFFIPAGSTGLVAAALLLYGAGYGAASFLLRAILADVTDQETAETGKERAGVYYALLVMSNKLGIALAPGIAFPLLDLVGFNPKGGNSPESIQLMVDIFVIVPMIFLFAAAAVMWNFPLDEAKQQALREQINARRAAASTPPSD